MGLWLWELGSSPQLHVALLCCCWETSSFVAFIQTPSSTSMSHIRVPLQHPMSVPFMELLRVLAAALRSTPAWLPSRGHFRAVTGRIRG